MSQMVEQILAVNRHLRAAIDQVQDGVLIIDADLTGAGGPEVVFLNAGFCNISRCRREELVGRPLSTIFPQEHIGAIKEFLEGVGRNKGQLDFPAPLETSLCGGEVVVLDGCASAMLSNSGTPLNFTLTVRPHHAQDVATREPAAPVEQTANATLADDHADLDSGGASHSKTEHPGSPVSRASSMKPSDSEEIMEASRLESLALVAGGIAHDFNNVLTTILANLSLAMPMVEDSSDVSSCLRQAASASEKAKGLAKKLLSFARGGKPKKEITEVRGLLDEAIELSTYGSNVRCDARVDDGLHAIEVDPIQLIQIFNNLLINAWQAMPGGGVIQATAENIYVHPEEDPELEAGPYVVVSVRDRGCGIPEDKLDHIFDAFYTTKKNGSGLGLATCATVIRDHGGVIRVKSKVGAGTVFRVYLPSTGRIAPAEPVKTDAQIIQGKGVIRGSGGSVLVVDDQAEVLDVACLILGKLGYEVHRASNGQEGVEMYRYLGRSDMPIEAVLMDMTLPGGMNGQEATAEIRRLDPSARVVATSGFFDGEALDSFRSRGFIGILPKPFTVESLSQAMNEALTAQPIDHHYMRPPSAGSGEATNASAVA